MPSVGNVDQSPAFERLDGVEVHPSLVRILVLSEHERRTANMGVVIRDGRIALPRDLGDLRAALGSGDGQLPRTVRTLLGVLRGDVVDASLSPLGDPVADERRPLLRAVLGGADDAGRIL
jgi:hypothetical protein